MAIALAVMLTCSSWGAFGVFAEDGFEDTGAGASPTTAAAEASEADMAPSGSGSTSAAEAADSNSAAAEEDADNSSSAAGEDAANSSAADEEASSTDTSEVSSDDDTDNMTATAEGEFSTGLPEDAFDDLNIDSSEELLEGYMKSHAVERKMRMMEGSSRAWNLSGNDLIYYNLISSVARDVAAGKRSATYDSMPGSQILSKTSFTAADLGLKTIAEKSSKSSDKLVLTDTADKKIKELMKKQLGPNDWTAVVTAALLDMPYELYWFNRYNTSRCIYRTHYSISFNATSFTVNLDPAKTYAEIWMPLIEDYGLKEGNMYKIYIADTDMTGAAASAISNARTIVSRHQSESDYNKLKSYLDEVCRLTDYDTEAAERIDDLALENYQIYNSPWQLISVFDGDPDTKVVCAGYGKAYKYLCDISTFDSYWIECQTMYGTIQQVGRTSSPGAHLWCTVRMNNGLNYIVDPTWHDGGYNVFLKGGKYDSSKQFCDTVASLSAGSATSTLRYAYNDRMKKSFSAEELAIASADYDPETGTVDDVPIAITPARISGVADMTYSGKARTGQHPVVQVDGRTLTEGVDYTIGDYRNNVKVGKASFVITGTGQYIGSRTVTFKILPKGTKVSKLYKGKKSFRVKWKKQSSKMSKSRITGYQIQYSTSKTFASGNKTVKVKGYKSTSKTIKKLKKKKKYYVRIRTYRKTGGVTCYSAWSPAKSIKTK